MEGAYGLIHKNTGINRYFLLIKNEHFYTPWQYFCVIALHV